MVGKDGGGWPKTAPKEATVAPERELNRMWTLWVPIALLTMVLWWEGSYTAEQTPPGIRTGVVRVDTAFDKPGKYSVIVALGEGSGTEPNAHRETAIIRFPLQVGQSGLLIIQVARVASSYMPWFVLAAIVGAAVYFLRRKVATRASRAL